MSCRQSVLLACVDAQREYFDQTKQSTLPLGSTPHAWSLPPDSTTAFTGRRFSPLGRLIDRAQDAGVPGDFVDDKSTPYEGYYFRIQCASSKPTIRGSTCPVNEVARNPRGPAPCGLMG